MKLIIKIILIGFIISFLSIFILTIFVPAALSTYGSCTEKGIEKLEKKGYQVLGQVSTIAKDNGEKEISVEIQDYSEEVLQHEYCHVKQFQDNRSYSCKYYVFTFINELECYIAEELPHNIYKSIYGGIPDVYPSHQ